MSGHAVLYERRVPGTAGAVDLLSETGTDRCDAEAARRYGFEGLNPPAPWPSVLCEAGARHRMLLLRSPAAGEGVPELNWHVYEICEVHVSFLKDLDDALLRTGRSSQLHPLTGAALRLVEPPAALMTPPA